MTDEPATRTLTYREVAAALSISVKAAEARARRRIRQGQWRASKGNDGAIRLIIPIEELQAIRTPTEGVPEPTTEGTTGGATEGATNPYNPPSDPLVLAALQQVLASLAERDSAELQAARALAEQRAAEVAELRERVGRAEVERDHARAERERVERKADELQAELVAWTTGGPVARALRAFLNRR